MNSTRLRALETKVKVANELKRPDLLSIADKLPSITDEEALKTVMSDMVRWSDERVQAREQQLMSGVTPGVSAAPSAPTEPATQEAWMQKLNGSGTTARPNARKLSKTTACG